MSLTGVPDELKKTSAQVRSTFLDFFAARGHAVQRSASLIPRNDPTLMFVNAGMVPFKDVFTGKETRPYKRATSSQKCMRVSGKHNDLDNVGPSHRHHTFFEMLGNFSFGDYFKRDAIRFAWELLTVELGIPKEHLRVTVFESDDEARELWKEVCGISDSRIYGLGAHDNFWQMADTGPCGPCTEIYVDLAHIAGDWAFPDGATGEWTDTTRTEFSRDAFVEGAEAGRFLEIWNLVFMQFDRQPDGVLKPLPKPSVDTGAGLERIAAVLQGVTNNYHTDLFVPLIAKAEEVLGMSYDDRPRAGVGTAVWPIAVPPGNRPVTYDAVSFRVLADHARAIAFLIADGVFPSNEGRGYVLRRILRRGVRHAWLLGRRERTLDKLVSVVVDEMKDVDPELAQRRALIVDRTRAEEERFLATIEEGMLRFDQLAPAHSTQGSTGSRGTISGADAFRLYDTFGFPIDLTELMARERGYLVDIVEFEKALEMQRTSSRDERRGRDLGVGDDGLADPASWEKRAGPPATSNFVGYNTTEIDTEVIAVRHMPGGRLAMVLAETPFYAESGGQISDAGEIVGDGWRLAVDEVKKVDGRNVAIGDLTGAFHFGRASARVPADRRRDTERNHTATHLLHAALRQVLGEHVTQAGSLVAPDRLRFDFHHHGPVRPEQLEEIEELVNRGIWSDVDVGTEQRPYREAVASGAMALFGEKYGDVVRVVSIPGLSMELCGGTHARNTGQIALFKIVSETGVAAGIRRIEAVTGPRAYQLVRAEEQRLHKLGELLRAPADGVVKRVETLLEERRKLEKRLEESLRGGGDQLHHLLAGAEQMGGSRLVSSSVTAGDVKELQQLGDALREQLGSGVGVIATTFGEGKSTLLVVVTDDLRERGVRADQLIKPIAEAAGGRGGGKAHMAQAGIPDAARIGDAIARAPAVVRAALAAAA